MPFRLGTTSFIHPGGWLFNVERLAPRVEDVELLFFEVEQPDDLPQPAEVDALVACKERFGLSYTVHTPLAASLASENEQRRRQSVDQVRRSLDFASELQPDGYVVHVYLGDREGDVRPSDLRAWRSRAGRSLAALCQTVPASRLCVETLDYDFGLLEPVVDELGLSVAVDIGHLHRDRAPLRDVLLRNLHRTRMIQWHGTNAAGRDHRSLAFFPRSEASWLIDTLDREAYTGVLTIEVFAERDLDESLAVVREISRERCKE